MSALKALAGRVKRFPSKRNAVYRLSDGTIEKIASDDGAALSEAERLRGLRASGVAVPDVLGVTGASLHLAACPGEPLPDFLMRDHGDAVLRESARAIAAWFAAFYRALDGAGRPQGMRGDVNGRNLLIAADGVWGVDFEDDAVGERAADAGRLMAFVRTYRVPDAAAQAAFARWLEDALVGTLGLDAARVAYWERWEYAAMRMRRGRQADGRSAPLRPGEANRADAPRCRKGADPMQDRYVRQMCMPHIGAQGQARLAASNALVIGAGGLGSALLYALAGAGVGHIDILDGDTVSKSNLNRQFLYTQADIGREKAAVAARRLRAYNPDISLGGHRVCLSGDDAQRWLAGRDIAILAVDNVKTRLLVGDAAYRMGVPVVDGGVNGWMGSVLAVSARRPPCLRCFYEDMAQPGGASSTPGALGAVTSAIASLQATVALRLLLGLPNPLEGKLLLWEAGSLSFETLDRRARAGCAACGGGA